MSEDGGQSAFCHIYSSLWQLDGGIAQLVERLVRNEKARGSNPLTSSFPGFVRMTIIVVAAASAAPNGRRFVGLVPAEGKA